MDLNVSFRHADASPAVFEHIERRARAVAEKLDPDCRMRVVCGHDAGFADVEAIGTVAGCRFVARAGSDDMVHAVDTVFERLVSQVTRSHDRRVRRRRARRHDAPAFV